VIVCLIYIAGHREVLVCVFHRPWFNLTRLWARSPSIPYLGCWRDRQPRMAAKMILGVKTAIRALRSVEGMDRLGPAYLMTRETAAERVNTLRMGLMLVFMDVVVGWAIGFQTIIASMCCGCDRALEFLTGKRR